MTAGSPIRVCALCKPLASTYVNSKLPDKSGPIGPCAPDGPAGPGIPEVHPNQEVQEVQQNHVVL